MMPIMCRVLLVLAVVAAVAAGCRERRPPVADPAVKEVTWVRIPGGSFSMGSTAGEQDERPVRRVTLRAFWLARSEVTVAQYKACVAAGACAAPDPGEVCTRRTDCTYGRPGMDTHPVSCVTWRQARAFCRWAASYTTAIPPCPMTSFRR